MNKARTTTTEGLSTINSIQRPDLVTLVTESIRQRILDGSYAPGHVLPSEAELIKAFSVSRNVMREALRTLRVLGLVEVTQGRRPRVSDISTEASINALGTLLGRCEGTIEKLMAARIPLEIQVVTLLARGVQAPDLTEADQINRDMIKSDDHKAYTQADLAFHRGLAKATDNEILATILEAVTDLTFKMRMNALLIAGADDWPSVAKYRARIEVEHNSILEAIKRRDEVTARNAMTEHLEGVADAFRNMEEALKSGSVSDGKGER